MSDCPCGLGRAYAECCEPFHQGVRLPDTAEQLMRSRYSAFAQHRVEYLGRTLHPSRTSGYNEKDVRDWSYKSEWLGLEVVAAEEGGPDDSRGTVEFIARFKPEGRDEVAHHEVAEFRRKDGRWFFYEGKVRGGDPITRDSAKVGRNDPCPCGSGKKHKKCCG